MKHKMNRVIGFVLGMSVVLGLTFSTLPAASAQQTAAQQPDPLDSLPAREREMVIAFRERVKDYAKLRAFRDAVAAEVAPT